MEPVYIVMICSAALFALLLLAYFMRADVQRKLAERKEEELEKAYSDENLKKMEYDVAVYDEETRKKLRPAADSQVTMDEVLTEDKAKEQPSAKEILFGKVDGEGMEEIKGDFKGD